MNISPAVAIFVILPLWFWIAGFACGWAAHKDKGKIADFWRRVKGRLFGGRG